MFCTVVKAIQPEDLLRVCRRRRRDDESMKRLAHTCHKIRQAMLLLRVVSHCSRPLSRHISRPWPTSLLLRLVRAIALLYQPTPGSPICHHDSLSGDWRPPGSIKRGARLLRAKVRMAFNRRICRFATPRCRMYHGPRRMFLDLVMPPVSIFPP